VLDDFRYHSIDLEPAGDERIDDVIERVVRVHSLLADHDYYLALPQGALDRARVLLDEADVPDDQIRTHVMAHP